MPVSKSQEMLMRSRGYVPVRAVAAASGRDVTTIYRHIRDGSLPAVEVAGTKYVSYAAAVKYVGPDGAKLLGMIKPETAPPPKAGS